MRDKNLLHLFLALNVGLGACFVAYLFISRNNQPKVVATTFHPAPTNNSALKPASPAATPAHTNDSPASKTNSPDLSPVLSQRKFNFEQIESPEYQSYINSLRAVGCPEDKVRYIIMADVNELFAKKRKDVAITNDSKWWKAQPDIMIANALQQKGREIEEERRSMIEKLLGSDALENEKSESMLWTSVQLTGPVLGALPTELHNTVQEICARSLDRQNGAIWARVNEGQGPNTVEMAKLREQTRADLRRTLNAEQMEEFLLRFSHNSQLLRYELQGFEPTPDEFRKIFRAIDPIQHQLQLEYGGLEALSQQQRERLDRQRDAAIKETLTPDRYTQFLVTKDPLYRQAQAVAQNYGAPPKAILPLYQMTKATEARRQKIYADATLTQQQKAEAINILNQDQMRSVQQIVSEAQMQR